MSGLQSAETSDLTSDCVLARGQSAEMWLNPFLDDDGRRDDLGDKNDTRMTALVCRGQARRRQASLDVAQPALCALDTRSRDGPFVNLIG